MSAPQADAGTAAKQSPRPPRNAAPKGVKPAPRPRRPGSRISSIIPYLLVAPAILGIVFLLLYPVLRNTIMSFQHFRMRELISGGQKWVGFDNYSDTLTDPEFWTVVKRTFVFTAVNVVAIMVLSTLIALMLMRLGKAMRITVMIGLVGAWAMPVIAATTVFQWLFQSQYGVVNWFLVKLGFDYEGYTWFADAKSTMTVVVLLIVWQSVPFATLTIYAGLTTIPNELYESARLDGAGPVRIFRSVTYPILRPIFLLMTSLEIIWVFKSFAQIWAIAGRNGPIDEVRTLPVYAYQMGRVLNKYDLAGAISLLTVLILAVALIFYFRQMFKQEREAEQ